MLKGFRDFITRGNVIDLAVAVVIGGAFTALVAVFTRSLIQPMINLAMGGGVDGGKTTPHMYVVGPAGKLAYMGALDNAPLGKVDGGGARQDLVGAALGELLSGKPVTQASTQSYGCGVKYQ